MDVFLKFFTILSAILCADSVLIAARPPCKSLHRKWRHSRISEAYIWDGPREKHYEPKLWQENRRVWKKPKPRCMIDSQNIGTPSTPDTNGRSAVTSLAQASCPLSSTLSRYVRNLQANFTNSRLICKFGTVAATLLAVIVIYECTINSGRSVTEVVRPNWVWKVATEGACSIRRWLLTASKSKTMLTEYIPL